MPKSPHQTLAHAPEPRRLEGLTSLRFLAAMTVLLLHFFRLERGVPAEEVAGRPVRAWLGENLAFLAHGHLAVDFFFVLSGFVLAHVYLPKLAAGRFGYGDFLRRRVARLVPLHLATLGAFLALLWVTTAAGRGPKDAAHFDAATLPFQLTLTHAWGFCERLTFNGPSWSISAEWAAYLAFPAVVWLASAVRPWAGVLGAAAWFLAWEYGVPGTLVTTRTADFGIMRIAAEFPLGVAAWRVFEAGLRSGRGAVALAIVGAVAAWAGLHFGLPAAAVFGFTAIIAGVAAADRAGRLRWLSAKPLVYGGEISYSIYMTHALVQVVLDRAARPLLDAGHGWAADGLLLAGVAATVWVSHLSFQWIERPGQRLLTARRTGRRSPQLPAPAQPAQTAALRP